MELRRRSEFADREGARVFREAPYGVLALTLFLLGGGVVWASVAGNDPPLTWVLWLPAAFCFGIAALFTPAALRGLRRGPFVLLHRREGIALGLRSFLNEGEDDGRPTVVWIPSDEVRAVRATRHERSLPDSDGGTVTTTERALEIELDHRDTRALAEALEHERARRPRGGRFHQYLVRLTAPGRLVVTWRSSKVLVRPGLDRALAVLGTTLPVTHAREDAPLDWREVPDDQLDDLIVELIEAGRTIDACKVLVERRGWSLTRARVFVQDLAPRAEAA
jgi:hypothetical protein